MHQFSIFRGKTIPSIKGIVKAGSIIAADLLELDHVLVSKISKEYRWEDVRLNNSKVPYFIRELPSVNARVIGISLGRKVSAGAQPTINNLIGVRNWNECARTIRKEIARDVYINKIYCYWSGHMVIIDDVGIIEIVPNPAGDIDVTAILGHPVVDRLFTKEMLICPNCGNKDQSKYELDYAGDGKAGLHCLICDESIHLEEDKPPTPAFRMRDLVNYARQMQLEPEDLTSAETKQFIVTDRKTKRFTLEI